MNGRVYDPQVARFVSPAPFVQAPGNWLNYDRYAYCMNNPLVYSDPSGNKWKWDWINPVYWLSETMQVINDNTTKLRKTMTNIGVPDFNVGINSAGNTMHQIGNNDPVYHNQLGNNYERKVNSAIADANGAYVTSKGGNGADAALYDPANIGVWSPYNLSGETRLVMATGSTILGPMGGLAHFPDAISIELNGSAGAVVATNTSPIGGLFKMNMNIKGASVKSYFQGSVGVGTVFGSADVVLTQYYIIGPNAGLVSMSDFNGTFYSGNIGVDVGFSLGIGYSWSYPRDGAYIIGMSRSIGFGASPTMVSGGAYWGQMDFYSNHTR